MALPAGTRLGSYEVLASIGSGGMGEVYRAADTKLGREVALKILPESFAADPDRLMRFEREARTLATLNHPHIAQIYGVEEGASARALVMELVEGEDLAARLARGPIPVDEALPLARQIAEALEAAHDAGIIHRDLKPANVKVRPDGTAKVLDFGLARAADASGAGTPAQAGRELVNTPTITSPALMTMQGVILGTAAYMSPEQAKGKPVDKRADIWAFGCVLYEMLAGRRAFEGEDITDTIVAVASREPDWSALPAGTPRHVRQLLRRCLVKDARQRLRDIGDARLVLGGLSPDDAAAEDPGPPDRARHGRQAFVLVALLGAFMAGGLAGAYWLSARSQAAPPAAPVVRFTVTPPDGTSWARFGAGAVVSPDGTMLLLHLAQQGTPQLWLRPLDVLTARPLPGTEGAASPFWSPDSRAVGFVAGNALKTLQLDTGRVAVVCDPCTVVDPRWGHDNRIRFTRGNELVEVPAAGGEPSRMWPSIDSGGNAHLLPGAGVLYESGGLGDGQLRVNVATLDGQQSRVLYEESGVRNSRVLYAEPGYILYVRNHAVMARPFDPRRLELTGQPLQIAGGAGVFGPGQAILSASTSGVLVYGNIRDLPPTELTWVSRDGRATSTLGPPGQYYWIDLSRDDARVAVERVDAAGEDAVWMMDAARGTMTRLTTEIGAWTGVWGPDGRRLAYSAAGPPTLYVRSIDADDPGGPVGGSPIRGFPSDWSADGKTILYAFGGDVMAIEDAPGAVPVPYLTSPANESQARLSPDGRLAAYVSNESGVGEVYVAGFPRPGERVRVSLGGGRGPRWRGDGRELFYLAADGAMMSADVTLRDGRLQVSAPRRLFQAPALGGRPSGSFAVSSDGQRFLLNVITRESATPVTVVLNWPAELSGAR